MCKCDVCFILYMYNLLPFISSSVCHCINMDLESGSKILFCSIVKSVIFTAYSEHNFLSALVAEIL